MKREDKELLLIDLCARLPYGVKIQGINPDNEVVIEELFSIGVGEVIDCNMITLSDVKPYLFPLSSMTEEIMDEIYEVSGVYDIGIDSPIHIEVGTTFEDLTKIFHILNKHHFDYRGLIEKGLAIDATNLNIY